MSASAGILDRARRNREAAPDKLARIALGPIEDSQLRRAMMENPRLASALQARLEDGGALALPQQLPPFSGDTGLAYLLTLPLDKMRFDIGLGWYANALSAALIDGRKFTLQIPHDALRRALALRDAAPSAQIAGTIPETEHAVAEAGRLCLAAWCGALERAAALITMELDLIDASEIRSAGEEHITVREARRRFMSDWINRAVPKATKR